jgi:hypothetical protein
VGQVERVRLVALVGSVVGGRRTTHTSGYPLDVRKMLPMADVVLLEAGEGPGVMLYRYTAQGELAGDTWHESVTDAREQALFEYRDSLGRWEPVPAEVTNAHEYAIRYATAHREA